MRGWNVALLAALTVSPALAAPDAPAEEGARRAALDFGRALTGADASLLDSLVPARGKIRLRLVCLGPEEGSYSGSQVVALLRDFLRQGSVRSFSVSRIEGTQTSFALVHARAQLTDREGRSRGTDVHLTLQKEQGRWVLRELRESPP